MNSTSENDLQKAIDDIARAGGGQSPSTLEDAAKVAGASSGSVVDSSTDIDGGAVATSPTPYIETDGQVSAGPEVSVVSPVVEPTTSPALTPPVASGSVKPTVSAPEGPKGDSFSKMDARTVRDRAIDDLKPMIGTVDLTPILSKVDLLPETRFKIYKSIIETTRDKDVLGPAYATAKEIPGDTARAEALLYLVEIVDKLS